MPKKRLVTEARSTAEDQDELNPIGWGPRKTPKPEFLGPIELRGLHAIDGTRSIGPALAARASVH
jgi:hypothetical protein